VKTFRERRVNLTEAKKVAGNTTTRVKNATEVAKGTVMAKTANALCNRHLETKGKLEVTKGKVKQTGQRLKEAPER
jgi:uncharacterized protein YjbJ (UPF0337 family)